MAFFLSIDLAFFGANVIKIADGGWFPIVVGLLVFTVMTTWQRGRQIITKARAKVEGPLPEFVEGLVHRGAGAVDVDGNFRVAVFQVGAQLLDAAGYGDGLEAPLDTLVFFEEVKWPGSTGELVVGDMTDFRLARPVDAAICMQDSQGHLLTNAHVVGHASRGEAAFEDGTVADHRRSLAPDVTFPPVRSGADRRRARPVSQGHLTNETTVRRR